ncbi:conserved hypothetical protein [Echinococcus multilocularis]|uniref:Uncharacterized protein n=1 Tax=Echinococcus multilocularis TaxID=6211 RepID=A0A087W2J1_ECHMU|nr:conserved hypothetical protein [Echinococcus multilocularis]
MRRIDRLSGIIEEGPNHRKVSNSTKNTRGDCDLPMANQDVTKVKPPSMPSTSFAMERGEILSTSGLKQKQIQGSPSPLDSEKFVKKHSFLQVRSKSLQRIAQHWLWKAHDSSKMKKPVCEKFELEPIDSKINSSLFDDPPYEKDEISFSDPPSCGESAAEKYAERPPDVQQNNYINCDFGDWPQSGDSSTKALYANRRTKRSLKSSKRQPNLRSGDQKPEVFDVLVNNNVGCTIPHNLNCAIRGVGEDTVFHHSQLYAHPKSNVSLPEFNPHRGNRNISHKTSSLSSFFDAFSCAEDMWCSLSPNNSKPYALEKPHSEYDDLSQRTYVIAKIDLNESFGPRTYSIASNSHSEVDDTVKNECLKQRNNNATNEAPRKVDFALPGVVQKPPSFLSLIKEARAANMIPPSLSTPSYSWEKKETPENDYMTLPARRPRQQKQQADESEKVSSKHVTEELMQIKSATPPLQINQNSTTETKVPSLQSVIETMQKLKATEMQMKAIKEKERIKKINGESEKAITASQAMENAKGMSVVDYKERRRLRHQKELDEARKELLEATRSALRDRIAFSRKEGKSTSSFGVSKTLFCGSTKAMFNPDASLGDVERVPVKVEEKEVSTPEPVANVPKTEPPPYLTSFSNASKIEVEKVAATNFDEPPRKELKSTPPEAKKSRKKTDKQVNGNKNANVLPPNIMQIVPMENTLAEPSQNLAMPSQMLVPVPVSMPQYGMMLPFSFPQYAQPNFYCIQNPWEFTEHPSGVQGVYISETSSSGSTSSGRYRQTVRSKPRRHKDSPSFSSFSETSSFSSGTTFSTNSESSGSSLLASTSETSSSPDQNSKSSTSSLSNAPSRASPGASHSSTSPPATPMSSDSSSCND